MSVESKSLNVLMSATSYPENSADWRGRFIANLTGALAKHRDVRLSLWAPPGEIPHGVTDATTVSDACWLGGLSRRGGIAHLLRTRRALAAWTVLGLLARLGRAYRRPGVEVVHVNWLQNALPLWGTPRPALITVLGTDFALLRLPGMKMLLRHVLRQRRAILAPNADWMRPALERAFGDLAEIRTIAFGVDRPWFDVVRRVAPDNVSHWLTVTRLTKDKIGDLFGWGDGLFGPGRQLHLFGPMQEAVELPSWAHYHGPTHPADLMTQWFPVACGLITLSRHDEGRPQVMLEAMAAGLPVIASDLPAHREIVEHRHTGWLATDREALARGLEWLENPLNNRQTGQAAQRYIRDSLGSWDDCASRYVDAYEQLLDAKR